MAITNHDRVGKAMEALKAGLAPFINREIEAASSPSAKHALVEFARNDRNLAGKTLDQWDVAALLKLMWDTWNDVFRETLGHAERSLVSELRGARNDWAHQQPFSGDDAYRVLDSTQRLLTAVSAAEASEIEKMKRELLRTRFDEEARTERRKTTGTVIVTGDGMTLRPWRDVVQPHEDVATGNYQQAEFAADLWQVHVGDGADEYRNPAEFFRRTFLTASLKELLIGAIKRLNGTGGNPVVQLQTNFGGGKTHSMLALYHLVSGAPAKDLLGVEELLAQAQGNDVPVAKRVVLVGNKISPGNPTTKPDGTVVRTLWGELAYQLGGREAFDRIRQDDERATNPGDRLRELFDDYGPCLILVDEWVAYARQLHDEGDLPGGDFGTQFTFAQALTESAKLAKKCLLVVSLPASDTAVGPAGMGDDIEVGGSRGREALSRLQNVVGRVESSWRPATAEEGFEIVRRRLFQPIVSSEQFNARDNISRAFSEMYQTQRAEFPPECADADYEKRLRAAYPIHPEVFDRLYNDWSTLVKFQRTRGVLRLMAAVIHTLWEKGDRNPLIMPAMLPIDDPRVQSELTRYLPDAWGPIIERDVDGPNSLPAQLDSEQPNLGRLFAARRVARTVYLGSAPLQGVANRGLEDRRIRLGSAMPGESVNVFGDALRRLANRATYLYADGTRYWYATQPTVTKLADDRAEQYKRDQDKVVSELQQRLAADLAQRGDFARVHLFPGGSADVVDDMSVRLVVLQPHHAHSKEEGGAAEVAAKAILESRGNAPRQYRNTLVFLAADKTRYQDLEEAIRKLLAWQSIVAEQRELNLTPHQVTQAETQKRAAESTVAARVPETFHHVLVPTQASPQAPIVFQAVKVQGGEALAIRAAKKLKAEGLLLTNFGGTVLRLELDKIPLWRGDSVSVKQLANDFAQYVYLSRLASPAVLAGAVQDGVGLMTWEMDSFAYADDRDEAAGRFRGLKAGVMISLDADELPGLVVKPDVADEQMVRERRDPAPVPGPVPGGMAGGAPDTSPGGLGGVGGQGGGSAPRTQPRRYHAVKELDPARVARDAGDLAAELISHLVGVVGAEVSVTLEVHAKHPDGFPDNVVRIVLENGRVLRVGEQGFEGE